MNASRASRTAYCHLGMIAASLSAVVCRTEQYCQL